MSQIQITNAFVDEIRVWIERELISELGASLELLFPADIAELFDELNLEECKYCLDILPSEKAVEVIVELKEDTRQNLLLQYSPEEIAHKFIEEFDSDDAVDILNELPKKVSDEIISHVSDLDFSIQLVSLLHHDDNTAGGLMAKELIKVNINWNLAECTEEIRKQAENVRRVTDIYVVDDHEILLGIVSLKDIILERAYTKVSEIFESNVISAQVYSPAEDVANLMSKYDLDALPITDTMNRLVGLVTIDDVIDFVKEEADKDYQMLSGISEVVESTDKIWILSRSRLPWLIIGLGGGLMNSFVIQNFESNLSMNLQLALFMPLVAAMGGNAGVQSSSIIVQGLANDTLGSTNVLPKLTKEFLVALINGLICSGLLLLYAFITGSPGGIAKVVSIALLSVILFASVIGTVVPLILEKLKIDPALATGPFITTTNDLVGLFVYFQIARAIL
ncbi:MAG: magnesium transporter [Flavobacteriales bacterium]|nr:magnesium transporter [Flavobacteriales bacterium]